MDDLGSSDRSTSMEGWKLMSILSVMILSLYVTTGAVLSLGLEEIRVFWWSSKNPNILQRIALGATWPAWIMITLLFLRKINIK